MSKDHNGDWQNMVAFWVSKCPNLQLDIINSMPTNYYHACIFFDVTTNVGLSKFAIYFRNGVLWSDETTTKFLAPSIQGGLGLGFGRRSLIMWGYFSSKGTGSLAKINGLQEIQCDFLKYKSGCLGQEATTGSWLDLPGGKLNSDQRINLLTWPSQSPDLNPIKFLWG